MTIRPTTATAATQSDDATTAGQTAPRRSAPRDPLRPSAQAAQALSFAQFGGPEGLALIPRPLPVPQAGEVLVRTAYATVNPSDLMMLSGQQAAMMTHYGPPYISGMEFSGHIAALGAQVAGLSIGQAVIGVVNPRLPQGGAHQDYVLVPAASVVALPEGADLAGAAALAMNGLTALMALEMTGLQAGAHLLVTGGSGILGGTVIALAKAKGLRVYAGGRAEDHDLLRGLGADEVLPRTEGLTQAARALRPQGLDGLIDGALIGDQVTAALRDGAPAISLRMSHPIRDPRVAGDYVSVIKGLQRQDLLAALVGYYAAGQLKPRIAAGGPIPIAQGARAFAQALAGGQRGRVLIDLRGPA